MDDKNIPNLRDFSFDINLMSPLSQLFQSDVFITTSANKMLKYFSSLKHTAFNHQMLMMSFKNIAEGKKIEEFKYFLKDFDEVVEEREKGPKMAHLLKTHEHSFGEFSEVPIKLTHMPEFEEQKQKHYDQTLKLNEADFFWNKEQKQEEELDKKIAKTI